MKKVISAPIAVAILLSTTYAVADFASKLSQFTGYTIAGSLTIVGWQDTNGKRGDSFEGCQYGRTIIFDNNKILTCATYSYSYAYRPTAVILVKGSDFKMVVEDESYDMNR